MALAIQKCTNFLRDLFRSRWKQYSEKDWNDNASLELFLTKTKKVIKKELKRPQQQIVESGKLEEWDISILYVLLTQFSWGDDGFVQMEQNNGNVTNNSNQTNLNSNNTANKNQTKNYRDKSKNSNSNSNNANTKSSKTNNAKSKSNSTASHSNDSNINKNNKTNKSTNQINQKSNSVKTSNDNHKEAQKNIINSINNNNYTPSNNSHNESIETVTQDPIVKEQNFQVKKFKDIRNELFHNEINSVSANEFKDIWERLMIFVEYFQGNKEDFDFIRSTGRIVFFFNLN